MSEQPPVPIDWPAIAHLLGGDPLPTSLNRLDALLSADIVGLDLWLYDYGLTGSRSLRTGARRTETRSDLDVDTSAWRVPLSHHGELLGYVTAEPADGGSPVRGRQIVADLAPLLAASVTTSGSVTDAVAMTRRRRTLSLAAEMQWTMLPPTRFASGSWVVSAAVEPAYETGGDVFDYAERDGRVILAVLDAMGHGLEAALVSAVALAGLRRARREGLGLLGMAAEIDNAVRALSTTHFVSAVLVDVDRETGAGFYLSAGHVAPVVISGGRFQELELVPALPLGLRVGTATSRPVVQPLALDPGQALVLYSDGIIDNRVLGLDEAAGFERFSQLTTSHLADPDNAHPARAVVNDLLTLTGPDLRDDATLLVARYG